MGGQAETGCGDGDSRPEIARKGEAATKLQNAVRIGVQLVYLSEIR